MKAMVNEAITDNDDVAYSGVNNHRDVGSNNRFAG